MLKYDICNNCKALVASRLVRVLFVHNNCNIMAIRFVYAILPTRKPHNKYLGILVKRTLSPYFRNLPLLHITIRLHLICRLLKFMQWLARKQYLLRRRTRQIRLNAVGRVKVGDNIIDL